MRRTTITLHDAVEANDGTVAARPDPETKAVGGGFAVADVPSREAALAWAVRIAVACRCVQEVREPPPDPNAERGPSPHGTPLPRS